MAIYNPVNHNNLLDYKTDMGEIRGKYGIFMKLCGLILARL